MKILDSPSHISGSFVQLKTNTSQSLRPVFQQKSVGNFYRDSLVSIEYTEV